MADAPDYRIWPPLALGVPLLAGVKLTPAAGDPFALPATGARIVGLVLVVVFGVWNAWTLTVMAGNRRLCYLAAQRVSCSIVDRFASAAIHCMSG